MANKTLLLISRLQEDQTFAGEVATLAGLSLKCCANPIEGAEAILQEEPCVILIDGGGPQDYSKLEAAIQEKIGLFSEKVNPNFVHFISSGGLEKSQHLIQSPLFGHFLLRSYEDNPKEAGQHYGRVVKAIVDEKIFGLENFFKSGTKVQSVKLVLTSQKQDAVEAVKNYLLAAKFQSRMATVISNAVDELLMNAMFDAPVDSLGKSLLSNTSRSTVIKLEGKSQVEMKIAYDGKYIAISVIDLFGSLDKAKLMNHISKIYTEEEYKVKTTVAGAGIGLATVFRSGGSFFFASEAQERTEVTVFFKRTENFREFKDQFRFLSTQFRF